MPLTPEETRVWCEQKRFDWVLARYFGQQQSDAYLGGSADCYPPPLDHNRTPYPRSAGECWRCGAACNSILDRAAPILRDRHARFARDIYRLVSLIHWRLPSPGVDCYGSGRAARCSAVIPIPAPILLHERLLERLRRGAPAPKLKAYASAD